MTVSRDGGLVPDGYEQALERGQALATKYDGLAGTKHHSSQRFQVIADVVHMMCHSRYAELAGHERGDYLQLAAFPPSHVERLSHQCKECAKARTADRKAQLQQTEPTTPTRWTRPEPVETSFFIAIEAVRKFATWEKASEFLATMRAPSSATVIEGVQVKIRRSVAFVRE
tara:strand:- start:150 stop:662 length:513 start_codon:yes stop_codon:yes gene_type:complete